MTVPSSLHALAVAQRGLLTRRQLADAGVTRAEQRWRLSRSWRLVLPGVVALGTDVLTVEQRHVAALLYAGPDSWLSGSTAAVVHGLHDNHPTWRVHVLVPPTRKPRERAWVSIRRSYFEDERIVDRGPLRISCRPRALVDAVAERRDDASRALFVDVVRRRLVRLDDVAHWIEARESDGRPWLHAALREAASGVWSLPEADLAALVRTSRVLPDVWANPTLHDAEGRRLTTPDLWFDDVGMAVMVHSRQFHAGTLDWSSTVSADSDLSACRIAVVGVTPEALARDPRGELHRIEACYRTPVASGIRPAVRAVPRVAWRTVG
ncbi:MAG TPA: hypothetical protein VFT68_00025 [Lapillicoccus sp.]|nr:hypothetical protein [Lapillicoccus sp.]